MYLILTVLSILITQSDARPNSSPSDSDQVILQIVKTGGVGGVHQECLVFRNGRMVLPDGTILQLDAKETDRLLTLAKRLPPKPKNRRTGGMGGASHDYPLWYQVRIHDAGKETEAFFAAEAKDVAVKEFVAAIKSHERGNKPQMKAP